MNLLMVAKSRKQVRIDLPVDKALDIALWGSKRGLSLPQSCSLICNMFDDSQGKEIERKLDIIIELLTKQKKD